MKKIINVLFLSDEDRMRAPIMLVIFRNLLQRADFKDLLQKAGIDKVVCESAGISHEAIQKKDYGHGLSPLALAEAERLGIKIDDHRPRWFSTLRNRLDHDLFVCTDKEIASRLRKEWEVPETLIYALAIRSPRNCSNPAAYGPITDQIAPAMDRVVFRIAKMAAEPAMETVAQPA